MVWLARDESLEREVAIKMLPEIVANDPVAVKELKRETARSQRLSHPRILRIYDFVESGPLCGITMEYVEGGTLAANRLEQPGEVFSHATLAKWVRQLCEALAYAHDEVQIVHRDLKPANLMIDRAGDLKVADFGIAASVSDSVSRVSHQASSSGTPVYMSPQQMMGDKPAVTDDLYALGATLYELLTGKPPFYSGNVILQVQSKVPPSMTARRSELGVTGEPIPAAWEATIAACLAKTPSERPQSATGVANGLQLVSQNRAQPSPDEGKSPLVSDQPRGKPTYLYAGIAAGLIGLVVIIWFGFRGIVQPDQVARVIVPVANDAVVSPEVALQPVLPRPVDNLPLGIEQNEPELKQALMISDKKAFRPDGVPAPIQTTPVQQQNSIKKLDEAFGQNARIASDGDIERMEAALAEATELVPKEVLSPYRDQLAQAKLRVGEQRKALTTAETKLGAIFLEVKLLAGSAALAADDQMVIAKDALPTKLAELGQAWSEWVAAGGDEHASMYIVKASSLGTTIALTGDPARPGVAGAWAVSAGEHLFTVQPVGGAARTALVRLNPRVLALVDDRGRLLREYALEQLMQADARSSEAAAYDISELDQRPVPREQVQPIYPFQMRRAGIEGEVVVQFEVDAQGNVRRPSVIRSSRQEFESSAIQAMSKWKFQPGRKGGRSVTATGVQQLLKFTIDE